MTAFNERNNPGKPFDVEKAFNERNYPKGLPVNVVTAYNERNYPQEILDVSALYDEINYDGCIDVEIDMS